MELLQGQNELVCLVYNYSPSAINITWLLNNVIVQHKGSTSSAAKGPDGKFSIRSQLNVQASEWAPGATYTCHVEHITGTINRNISKTGDFIFLEFILCLGSQYSTVLLNNATICTVSL